MNWVSPHRAIYVAHKQIHNTDTEYISNKQRSLRRQLRRIVYLLEECAVSNLHLAVRGIIEVISIVRVVHVIKGAIVSR